MGGGGYANTIFFYFFPSTFDPSCSRRATLYNPTKNWLKRSANYAKTCPEFFGWPKNCSERVCGIEKPGKICERKKKFTIFLNFFDSYFSLFVTIYIEYSWFPKMRSLNWLFAERYIDSEDIKSVHWTNPFYEPLGRLMFILHIAHKSAI